MRSLIIILFSIFRCTSLFSQALYTTDFSSLINKDVILFSQEAPLVYNIEAYLKNAYKKKNAISFDPWGKWITIKSFTDINLKENANIHALVASHEGVDFVLLTTNGDSHLDNVVSLSSIRCIDIDSLNYWKTKLQDEFVFNISSKINLPFYQQLQFKGINYNYENGIHAIYHSSSWLDDVILPLQGKSLSEMPIKSEEYYQRCKDKYGKNKTDSLVNLFVGQKVFVRSAKVPNMRENTYTYDSIAYSKPFNKKDALLDPQLILSGRLFPVEYALNCGVIVDSIWRSSLKRNLLLRESEYREEMKDFYNIAIKAYGKDKAKKIMSADFEWGDEYEAVLLGHWNEQATCTIHEKVNTPLGKAKEIRFNISNVSYYFMNNKLIGIRYELDKPFWVPKSVNWRKF